LGITGCGAALGQPAQVLAGALGVSTSGAGGKRRHHARAPRPHSRHGEPL